MSQLLNTNELQNKEPAGLKADHLLTKAHETWGFYTPSLQYKNAHVIHGRCVAHTPGKYTYPKIYNKRVHCLGFKCMHRPDTVSTRHYFHIITPYVWRCIHRNKDTFDVSAILLAEITPNYFTVLYGTQFLYTIKTFICIHTGEGGFHVTS